MTETSTCTPVHVAYSPIAFMNHQWTINLHDGYPSSHALMPVEYISPSNPTPCNLLSTIFPFGVDYLHPTKGPQHDLPSLASPKGEMTSSFSWTSLFKCPTSRTLSTLHFPGSIQSSQCQCVKLCFVPPNLHPTHSITKFGLVCIFKKNLL